MAGLLVIVGLVLALGTTVSPWGAEEMKQRFVESLGQTEAEQQMIEQMRRR